MKDCLCNVNTMGEKIVNSYTTYKEEGQILCNFLMSYFDNWNIYLVEHDRDVFRLNFCSKSNRLNDTSFLLTKAQLNNIAHYLECVIIPAIVEIEHTGEGCGCR